MAKKTGRPTIRSPELAQIICEKISIGESLRKICEADDMPAISSVMLWLSEDAAFSEQYTRARDAQADHYADEIIDIADTEQDASKARNRIEARKWVASKLKPKKYGDKLDMNVSGTIGLTDDQLESRIAQLLGKAGAGEAAGGA